MTRTYTADDFANARFAEHPRTGSIAMRRVGEFFRGRFGEGWTSIDDDGVAGYISDSTMSKNDWVPVPTKPVLTESEVKKMVGNYEVDDFAAGFAGGFRYAGGEITPDPGPTNTERLEEILKEVWTPAQDTRTFAEWLDSNGVTAPNVKDN